MSAGKKNKGKPRLADVIRHANVTASFLCLFTGGKRLKGEVAVGSADLGIKISPPLAL